jgi:hypothetical protein
MPLEAKRKEKGDARKTTYFYKICPACGAKSHLENDYCLKCKRRIEGGAVYNTENDPGVTRANLDYPGGCCECGEGCRWCFSFGMKEPSQKAFCGGCGKARAECCARARMLPILTDVMPDFSMSEILKGAAGDYKTIQETLKEMLNEAARECWGGGKGAGGLWDKRSAV